jgi:hypothetical protein
MLNKILNSYFVYKVNQKIPIIDFIKLYKEENSNIRKWFKKSTVFFKADVKTQNKAILLSQLVRDYNFTLKLGYASKILAEDLKADVYFYDVNWGRWLGWIDKVRDLYQKYFNSHIYKAYLSFGKKIIISNEKVYKNQVEINTEFNLIVSRLHNVEDIMAIKIKSVVVGDLLYDTYLRYFNKPTIDCINSDFYLIINVALNIFFNFEDIIRNDNIKGLLVTFSTYIEHGIPVRICLEKGIPVYSIGTNSSLIRKLTKEYPFHQIDHTVFSPSKKLSDEQISISKERLTNRFKGKIDPAVSYMRTTSFAQTTIDPKIVALFKLEKRNVVIYAHDFFDSPHYDRLLQFPDFYQFLKQTLTEIKDLENTSVFIKAHPNGINGNKEILNELVSSFNCSFFHILDEKVSNTHIVDIKPDLIVTCKGTIAIEMAYFEIPVIALYDNVYTNFDFTHTCHDLETYYKLIKGEIKPEINFDKNQLYSFYYQAYLEDKNEVQGFEVMQFTSAGRFSDEFLEEIKKNEELLFNSEIEELYRKKITKLKK